MKARNEKCKGLAIVLPALFLFFLRPVPCLALPGPHLSIPECSASYVDGRWNPLSLAVETRVLGYDLKVGWFPLNWGPAPSYNLTFSPTRGHLGVFMSADYHGTEMIPPFHWEQAYLFLGSRNGMERYMITRRYQIKVWRFGLGYAESTLLTGDFSPWYLDPYPFIPLMVTQLFLTYLGAERSGNLTSNATMAVDARYDGGRADLYFSFFVDDLPPTRTWANHFKIGVQAGVQIDRPFNWSGTSLWLDYTGITRHTYAYHKEWPQGDYVDGGLLLGHPLGPDADLLSIRLNLGSGKTWFELQRERHGEGRFPDPMDEVTRPTLEFLTGIVETGYWFRAGHAFAIGGRLQADLACGAAYVANMGNAAGKTGLDADLSARLAYVF